MTSRADGRRRLPPRRRHRLPQRLPSLRGPRGTDATAPGQRHRPARDRRPRRRRRRGTRRDLPRDPGRGTRRGRAGHLCTSGRHPRGLPPRDPAPGVRLITMRQISLGRTGLHVSEMIFGGAPIGGLYAPVNDDQAAAALEAAWTAGIRAFDTAPHYGVGLSEQRIGRFLAGRPREEFVLSTKIGRRLVPAAGDVEGAEGFYGAPKLARVRDYSRDGALAALEASL